NHGTLQDPYGWIECGGAPHPGWRLQGCRGKTQAEREGCYGVPRPRPRPAASGPSDLPSARGTGAPAMLEGPGLPGGFDGRPVALISSPTFIVSGVQPAFPRMIGAPSSISHSVVSPFSSFTSTTSSE